MNFGKRRVRLKSQKRFYERRNTHPVTPPPPKMTEWLAVAIATASLLISLTGAIISATTLVNSLQDQSQKLIISSIEPDVDEQDAELSKIDDIEMPPALIDSNFIHNKPMIPNLMEENDDRKIWGSHVIGPVKYGVTITNDSGRGQSVTGVEVEYVEINSKSERGLILNRTYLKSSLPLNVPGHSSASLDVQLWYGINIFDKQFNQCRIKKSLSAIENCLSGQAHFDEFAEITPYAHWVPGKLTVHLAHGDPLIIPLNGFNIGAYP